MGGDQSDTPFSSATEVNVESIMEEVRVRVEQKRTLAAYPESIATEFDPSAGDSPGDFEVRKALSDLRRANAFTPLVPTESSKPYVGPAISGVKKGVMRMTQWYIASILDQIRSFARPTTRTIHLLAAQAKQLEMRINSLEEEIARRKRE